MFYYFIPIILTIWHFRGGNFQLAQELLVFSPMEPMSCRLVSEASCFPFACFWWYIVSYSCDLLLGGAKGPIAILSPITCVAETIRLCLSYGLQNIVCNCSDIIQWMRKLRNAPGYTICQFSSVYNQCSQRVGAIFTPNSQCGHNRMGLRGVMENARNDRGIRRAHEHFAFFGSRLHQSYTCI